MKKNTYWWNLSLSVLLITMAQNSLLAKEVCTTRSDGARLVCPDGFHCERKGDSFDCVKKKPKEKSLKDKIKDKIKKRKTKAEKEKEKADKAAKKVAYREVMAEQAADKAQLSDYVYKDKGAPLGWKREKSYDMPSGLYAAVFKKDGETVLAFRGTEGPGNTKDVVADFLQGSDNLKTLVKATNPAMKPVLNSTPNIPVPQYRDASEIAKEVKESCNCELTLTGHSLGGGVAQYVAGKLDLEAYTFNAAGLSKHYYEEANKYPDRVYNLRVSGDKWSVGPHIGETITYPSKKNPHSMKEFSEYLNKIATID